ncbi:MAG: hypothetical protein R2864_06840 [Syntrophotaleaceae bacterium]
MVGLITFDEAFVLQEQLVAQVLAGSTGGNFALAGASPRIYPGQVGGSWENILDPIETVQINRGGDITYHAPGQLVGYPIVNLGRRWRDLRHYLRFLEEALIQVAADLGVSSYRGG